METLPDLLSEAIADATVIDTVDLGGGDVVAVTRESTHVYRSDGLLADESIETFGHDIDRLSVRTKRRKSRIQLETIDSETSFTVPSKIADPIVEAIIEGVLRTTGVVEADEEVIAQFRFSELTLVITDSRLLEHIGSAAWDGEFETVEYADLTGLDFEKGRVATQVVITTEDRRRRVKVPNEHAGSVRRQIQDAVFEFHDVSSLEELRTTLSAEQAAETETDSEPDTDDRSARSEAESDSNGSDSDAATDDFVSADWSPPADQDIASSGTQNRDGASQGSSTSDTDSATPADNTSTEQSSDPDIEAVTNRVETLSEQVERQTELLESQRELIEQLVDELRRGR